MCPENSHFHPKFPKTKAFATKILQVSGGHSLACTSPPHQSDGHQSLHPGPPNDKGYQGLRPDPPLPPLSPSSSSLPLDQSKQTNPSTSLVGAHLLSAPLLACRLAKGGGTSSALLHSVSLWYLGDETECRVGTPYTDWNFIDSLPKAKVDQSESVFCCWFHLTPRIPNSSSSSSSPCLVSYPSR